MNERRSFLKKTLAVSGALTFSSCASSQEKTKINRPNPSGVKGYNYTLPAFPKGSKLLFQGDSITDMKWGRNQKDRNHYLGHSYVYLIASRLGVDMAAAKLAFFNRGISGNTVGDLKKRWQKDTLEIKPDILSILIGVNDILRAKGKDIDIAKWEADYRFILDASRKQNPSLKIVLLNPFVLPSGRLTDSDTFDLYRQQIARMIPVVTQLAKDYKATQIHTENIFDNAAKEVDPAHWIWDGVHPLPAGHELIARNWLAEVAKNH